MTSIVVLITTIRTSLEIAVLIAAVSGCAWIVFGPRLRKQLGRSLVALLPLVIVFTYWVLPGLERAAYDLAVTLVATISLSTLVALLWLAPRSGSAGSGGSRSLLAAALTSVVLFGLLVDFFLLPPSLADSAGAALSTELLIRFGLFFFGVAVVALLALALSRSLAALSPSRTVIWATIVLAPVWSRHIISTMQMLLVKGGLAVSPSAFNMVAWLINKRESLLNVLLAVVLLAGIPAVIKLRRAAPAPKNPNPAQLRLLKAARRRDWQTLASLVSIVVLVGALIGLEPVLAAKEDQLSPAQPVKLVDGVVRIPVEALEEKHLYRFTVEQDGARIRFIVVNKGSSVFAAALDACKICGDAGYLEKGDNVVCKNCDAYINMATVGMPGGCNPIPIESSLRANFLEIDQQSFSGEAGRSG